MHSRIKVILLWVMLLCAVFMISGCKRDTGEENALVSVDQEDISADIKGDEDEDSKSEKTSADTAAKEETGPIYVDVCGHVKNPGVYRLTGESRVYEAIEKAGGVTKDAAAASVNQAERLTDGQQIYIPSKAEQKESCENGAYTSAGESVNGNMKAGGDVDNGKVNLNTASKEELLSLTGIGDVKADSIIKYREEHGSFQSVEDIKKIEGIKDGVFNKIKDQITV